MSNKCDKCLKADGCADKHRWVIWCSRYKGPPRRRYDGSRQTTLGEWVRSADRQEEAK